MTLGTLGWKASPVGLAVKADNPANSEDAFMRSAHVNLMGKELQKTLTRPIRCMVSMPPRHGKSSLISLWTPLWVLANNPEAKVGIVSYSAELSVGFSRTARNIAKELSWLGINISQDRSAAHHWVTEEGGSLFATSIGGALTGKGFNLLIIDDPVKGYETAASETQREKMWEWYQQDLYTRLEKNSSLFVVMTRWHEDDLIGRLLRQGLDEWEYIRLPAIAEDDDDRIGRKKGDILWPEKYDRAYYDDRRKNIGELSWAGLYQQRPAPADGGMFKRSWWGYTDGVPATGKVVRGWDLAATAGGGDHTVGVRMRRCGDKLFWVDDVVRIQGSPQDVERLILNTASKDGADTIIDIPQDPGQAGKNQVTHLTKLLAGYTVLSSPESGDKETRAMAYSSQAEVGNVKLKKAHWNEAYIEELAVFPNGLNDDQVDASSRAFHRLVQTKVNTWRRPGKFRRNI